MKVYAVQEIYDGYSLDDRLFATKELAYKYCEWKNRHQGSKGRRWRYTEIEFITMRLNEDEMQKDYSYGKE